MRELLVAGAGRERLRGPPVLEKKSTHGPLKKPNTLNIIDTNFVNIIDEPALVAEPSGS